MFIKDHDAPNVEVRTSSPIRLGIVAVENVATNGRRRRPKMESVDLKELVQKVWDQEVKEAPKDLDRDIIGIFVEHQLHHMGVTQEKEYLEIIQDIKNKEKYGTA